MGSGQSRMSIGMPGWGRPEGQVPAAVPSRRAVGYIQVEEEGLVVEPADWYPMGDLVDEGLVCQGSQGTEQIVDSLFPAPGLNG